MQFKKEQIIKIWGIHICLYFAIQSIFYLITENIRPLKFSKLVTTILFSPVIGLYGIFDKIGYLVIISVALMCLLKHCIKSYLLCYVLSLMIVYGCVMIVMFKDLPLTRIAIGLTITIFLNMYIMKRLFYED